jgi:branched-chain amino acid transport system substrate-binding protein
MTPRISYGRRTWPCRLALAALGALLCLSPAAAEAPFKIGAVASLTGPAAGFGKDYADGFKAYVDQWNKRGGFKGRPVAVEILDDETNPVNAVNVFRRLTSDAQVSIMWLAIPSNSALAIKALASETRVPIISGGEVDALGVPADPYFFKIAPGTRDFLVKILDWAKTTGKKRLAVILPTDAYGQTLAKYFKELAPGAGLEIVASETFAVTDTNFAAQLTKIRNAKPDLVYSGATGAPGLLVFKQYKQLVPNVQLASGQGILNRAFFEGIGGPAAAEGLLVASNTGALGAAVSGASGQLYKEVSDAIGRPATVFHTLGWDHGIATEWALGHSDGTREGIRAALDRIKDLPAVNGPITYRPDNHVGQDVRGIVIATFKDGKLTPVAAK